jgi:hypothetical protein
MLLERCIDQSLETSGIDTIKLIAGCTAHCPGTVYYRRYAPDQALQTGHIIQITFNPTAGQISRSFVKRPGADQAPDLVAGCCQSPCHHRAYKTRPAG